MSTNTKKTSSPIIPIKKTDNIANFVGNSKRRDNKPSPKKASVPQRTKNNKNTLKQGAEAVETDANPYAPIADFDDDVSMGSHDDKVATSSEETDHINNATDMQEHSVSSVEDNGELEGTSKSSDLNDESLAGVTTTIHSTSLTSNLGEEDKSASNEINRDSNEKEQDQTDILKR
jgi:hypothetical protein